MCFFVNYSNSYKIAGQYTGNSKQASLNIRRKDIDISSQSSDENQEENNALILKYAIKYLIRTYALQWR